MSRTRGEGRSGSERSQRVVQPKDVTRARRAARLAEEREWAAKNGPVVSRTIDEIVPPTDVDQ